MSESIIPVSTPFPPSGTHADREAAEEEFQVGGYNGMQSLSRANLLDDQGAHDRSRASDDELTTAAQDGDHDAFAVLCER